jgi:hypothetical protein
MTRTPAPFSIRSLCGLFLTLFAVTAQPAAAQPAAGPGDAPAVAGSVVPGPEAGSSPADASEQTPANASQVEELRRRVDILAAEVEQLRSGEAETIALSDQRRRALGLAPSAAATYRRASEGVSLAGYGEMLLENFAGANESGGDGSPTTRLDFLRAVLYAGYRFNDRFLVNAEIEFEHVHEVGVEFAYVDYKVNENFSLRGGLLLQPLGLINEFHEPNVFVGARRPETERRILPSTWSENGGGVLGSFGRLNFRAYVVNGLSASGFTSAGIREGRQDGAEAHAADVAFTGRLDLTPLPGITGGGGLYTGGSGQDAVVVEGQRLHVSTTIAEIHGLAQLRGFDVRGLYARATVDDAGPLSASLDLPLTAAVAERMHGGYVQAGYNVLARRRTPVSVMPYVRYEHVDTQNRVPVGFTRDVAQDADFKTLGVEVKPIPNVVLKTDYQWVTNGAGTGRNQFNVNLGYAF